MNARSAALIDLRRLVVELDGDHDDLSGVLADLVRTLTLVVPSFTGLHLELEIDGHPVTLTTLEGAQRDVVVTSLRWSLSPDGQRPTAFLTLYAERPGALVDLSADLDWVARRQASDGRADAAAAYEVRLDQDLPPPGGGAALDGLTELSVLNRAVGVLLEQGVVPEIGLAELARRAAGTGRDVVGQARYLVAGFTSE